MKYTSRIRGDKPLAVAGATTSMQPRKGVRRRTPMSGKPAAQSGSSLAAAATERIRDRILDLTLKPGMQLDEALLRRKLGISRTPAREALNRLSTEGLVEMRASRGFFVRSLDLGDIAGFFDAYLVAERSTGYLCRFSHPGLCEDLAGIQALHTQAIAAGNFLEISRQNAAFHLRIAAATENPHIVDFASRLHNLARRLAVFVYTAESEQGGRLAEQQRHIVREHLAIIAALRAGDRGMLLDRLSSHAGRFQQRISRFVGGEPRADFQLLKGA